MSEPDDSGDSQGSPALGRLVAAALALIFLMVGIGVFWIWRHARREQDWRDQFNTAQPFITPTNRPPPQ